MASWSARWDAQRTSWHLTDVNPYLKRYMKELLPGGSGGLGPRILVPLCGKAVDVGFLARNGYRVLGVEGVAKAVDELAAECSATGAAVPVALPPDVDPTRFRARALMPRTDAETATTMPQPVIVLEGDFLALGPKEAEVLVPLDAAFDRGGLVAVEPGDRPRYVQVLADMVAPGGRVLLVVTEHDPFANGSLGPPFEVTEAEVRTLCAERFDVKLLVREDRLDQDKGMRERGASRFHEVVYLLTRRAPPAAAQPAADTAAAPKK